MYAHMKEQRVTIVINGTDSYDLAKRILQERTRKKLSQAQLAKAIRLPTSHYCKIENGSIRPQDKTLIRIAEALDIPILELIELRDGKLVPPNFGEALRQLRLVRGIPRSKLERDAGLVKGHLLKIETGKIAPQRISYMTK